MKHFLILALAAIMLLVVMAGCTNKDNVSDNTNGSVNGTKNEGNIVDDLVDMGTNDKTSQNNTSDRNTTGGNSTEASTEEQGALSQEHSGWASNLQ